MICVVSSASAESEARFNAIVDEYSKFLRAVIARLSPDDLGIQAGEIEQEARLRLRRALLSERKIPDLASYIYKNAATATVEAIRHVKARREEQLRTAKEKEEPALPVPGPENSPERLAERQQIGAKIQQALERLPDNRRRAARLYFKGMTSQEIGDVMGWNEPKARNLTYRGLRDLCHQLRAEGIECEID